MAVNSQTLMPRYGRWLKRLRGMPRRAVPGLLPGHGALLQQGQDAVGDDLVRCVDAVW